MRARLPRRVRSLTYSCSCPLKEKPTGDRNTESPVSELLASAQVLVSAVTGVVDEKLRAASVGDQVSPSQLKVLKLVRMAGTLTVGEVATFLCVSDAAASKTIDRMVRRKQLRRAERRSDRRSSELRLTRTGRKLLGDYESAKARKLSRLFGDFGCDDLLRTARSLEQLTQIIVRESDPREICLRCGIYLQRCLAREASRANCSGKRERWNAK